MPHLSRHCPRWDGNIAHASCCSWGENGKPPLLAFCYKISILIYIPSHTHVGIHGVPSLWLWWGKNVSWIGRTSLPWDPKPGRVHWPKCSRSELPSCLRSQELPLKTGEEPPPVLFICCVFPTRARVFAGSELSPRKPARPMEGGLFNRNANWENGRVRSEREKTRPNKVHGTAWNHETK